MVSQSKSSARSFIKNRRSHLPLKSWRFLVVIVLVLGIYFRFSNLETKPYWWDEVINSIHSAGYSKKDFQNQLRAWKDKTITIEDLHKYQYPTSETNSLDVIRALADHEPQSPPLYYLLSRWWTQLFGSSVTVQRSLSAVISLFALPSMYWLCLELFDSSLAAWIGVMLMAISPFHLLYAQEVRLYVLWTVTILVSSASLLRAMRRQRKQDWAIYAVSLTLSLYVFPFSILVAIAHGIHVVIAEISQRSSQTRIKTSNILANYFIASIASIIAYAPWIVSLIQIDETKMANWRQITIPFLVLLKHWLFQTSIIFADLNIAYLGGSGISKELKTFYDPLSFYPMIFVWVIILYAFYFMARHSQQSIWSFILPLILTTAIAMALPDLIYGGIRSTIARYLIPCYLGIQLSIVNLIYNKINLSSLRLWNKKVWQFILAILLSIGIISCSIIINSPYWWIKSINYQNIPITNIINSSEKPLILTPSYLSNNLISISHNLTSEVTIQLVENPKIPEIKQAFSDQFLLNYPPKWLESIEQENKFKLEIVYQRKPEDKTGTEDDFSLVKIS